MAYETTPGEIWDQIIDCVPWRDDHQLSTLKACCLVQKSFVPRARRHLFHTVHLHRDGPGPGHLFHTLDTSPNLRLNVITLVMDNKGSDNHDSEDLGQEWFSGTLHSLSKNFPHLERLKMENIVWRDLSDSARASLFDGFLEVTHLELDSCDMDECSKLINSFPKLKSLEDGTGGALGPNAAQSAPPPDTLEAFSSHRWEHAASWLLMKRPAPPIRSLDLQSLTETGVPFLSDVIHTFGHQLESLDLSIISARFESPFVLPTLFSSLPALRVLSFFIVVMDDNNRTQFQWLPYFISSIQCAAIRSISFRILIFNSQAIDCIDWNQLDEALNRDDWKENLAKVSFTILGVVSVRRAGAQGFRERLPRLAHRKLLDFATMPPRHGK